MGNEKEDAVDDNGKLSPGEQAKQTGMICGNCRYHFPEHGPLVMPMPPRRDRIAQPSKVEALCMIVCMNGHSPNYQHLLTVEGFCAECEKIPPAIAVPASVANRMTDMAP